MPILTWSIPWIILAVWVFAPSLPLQYSIPTCTALPSSWHSIYSFVKALPNPRKEGKSFTDLLAQQFLYSVLLSGAAANRWTLFPSPSTQPLMTSSWLLNCPCSGLVLNKHYPTLPTALLALSMTKIWAFFESSLRHTLVSCCLDACVYVHTCMCMHAELKHFPGYVYFDATTCLHMFVAGHLVRK